MRKNCSDNRDHFIASGEEACDVLVVYLALLRWGFLFGCAPEEACVVLGAAVVVLAPEKYNSIAQWPC